MSSGTTHSATYKVIATDRGWQGSADELARLLARRFGHDDEEVSEALREWGRVEVAAEVKEEDAERLSEVLARIGITALIEQVIQEAAPSGAELDPQGRQRRQISGDTVLDMRGHSKVFKLPQSNSPRDTRMDWASNKNESSQLPGVTEVVVDLDQAAPALHRPLGPQLTPHIPRPAVFEKPEEAPLAPEFEPEAPPSVHPTVRLLLPEDEDEATMDDERALSEAGPLSEEEFDSVWGTLLPDFEGAPPPDNAVTTEYQRAVPLGLRPIRERKPLEEDDAPTRTDVVQAPSRGWTAVLGDDVQTPPLETPEFRTGQWEVSFESLEQGDPTTQNPADLFDSSNLDEVARLAAGAGLDVPDSLDEPVRLRPPTPNSPALREPPAPFEPPQRAILPRREEPSTRQPGSHSLKAATWLSILLPGAGQVYNGQPLKGLLYGATFWLIAPWVLGVKDAARTAGSIRSGMLVPEGSGHKGLAALYGLLWVPVVALACFGLFRVATFGSGAGEVTQKETLSGEDVILARGAASMGIERAMYRSQRARRAAEAALVKAGAAVPGEPCFGLVETECKRRARVLIGTGAAACGQREWFRCQTLMNEALKLDPTNAEAWRYIVQAKEHLVGSGGRPAFKLKPDLDEGQNKGEGPDQAPKALP